ncbi:MAG: hypothetical protein DRN40_00795 [Thermoplasmata archaeon]|nr:MAG: hypothetical protein DRN40_00795 [Thermoplasmata archaeon]
MRKHYAMFGFVSLMLVVLPVFALGTRTLGTPPTIESFVVSPEEVFNDGEGNLTFTITVGGGENITDVILDLTPLGGVEVSLEGTGGVYSTYYVVPKDTAPGEYNITVTVRDNESEEATAWVIVTVLQYNRPPEVSAGFTGEITLQEDSGDYQMALDEVFYDPDEDELSYTLYYAGEEKGESFGTEIADVALTGEGRNLTITPRENAYGTLNFTVRASDGEYYVDADINLTVTPVNDPPTASINELLLPTEVETGTSVAFLGSGEDPDGDELNFTWQSSLQGVLGYGSSILAELTEVGLHNITLTVSDGEYEAKDWVYINVTPKPSLYSLTEGDVNKDYTDPEEDEIWWETSGSDYIYHRDGKPSFDIVRITSTKEGDNMMIRVTFRGTPEENSTAYTVYFVKPSFREEEFDKSIPDEPIPDFDEYFFAVTKEEFPYQVEGNDIVFTIPLIDIEYNGISNGTRFELFVTAYEMEGLLEGGVLDTAGYGAIAHEVKEGERQESFIGSLLESLRNLIIICVAGIVIVVLLIVVVVFVLRKKGGGGRPTSPEYSQPPSEGSGAPPAPPGPLNETEGNVWESPPPEQSAGPSS